MTIIQMSDHPRRRGIKTQTHRVARILKRRISRETRVIATHTSLYINRFLVWRIKKRF